MSGLSCEQVHRMRERTTRMTQEMESHLNHPHMLLSFTTLLVFPSLQISDKGLFDAENFRFVD